MKKKILLVFVLLLCACQTQNPTPVLADSSTSLIQEATAKHELPLVVQDTAIYKDAYKASGIVREIPAGSFISGEGCATTTGHSDKMTWVEGVFLMTEDGYLLVRDWTGEYVSGVCE